ncbi:MAG: GNAT family N-acetyltransferase [Gemmatimonadaceae bacterium]
MELLLERCTVRSWRTTDALRLAQLANDRAIWLNVRDRFPHPYTRADGDAFIAEALAENPERKFVICVSDQPVGAIGIELGEDIYRVSASIGYWLGVEWRGQGIASEALRALSAWAFEFFGLQRIHANVFTSNVLSARVLERSGFTLESTARSIAIKDESVTDEWVYVKLRGEE